MATRVRPRTGSIFGRVSTPVLSNNSQSQYWSRRYRVDFDEIGLDGVTKQILQLILEIIAFNSETVAGASADAVAGASAVADAVSAVGV
jgi:hypothetical protein